MSKQSPPSFPFPLQTTPQKHIYKSTSSSFDINTSITPKLMGNYASTCTYMIAPMIKTNKTPRVIFPSGEVRQFREPVKAAEIMLECPGFFVVNSRTLNINHCFSPLSADEDLEPGNIYIMFLMRRVNSMVTPADMAVFWMAGSNAGKRISGGGGGEVEVVEQPRLAVEGVEFGYRLAVCRSRKPVLDTIVEEPVGARYKILKGCLVAS